MKSDTDNYYKRIGFSKERSYYSMKRLKKELLLLGNKLIEKVPNPHDAKEHCNQFCHRKRKI